MRYEIKKLDIHSDERGWLAEMLKQEQGIKQIIVATIKPGQQRGGHYHLEQTDWMLVLGQGEILLEDIESKEKTKIKTDELKLVIIYPKTFHLVKNTSDKTIYFVEAKDRIYDPKAPDTYKR